MEWLSPTQKLMIQVRREQIDARWAPEGSAIRDSEKRVREYDDDRFKLGFHLDEPNYWGPESYAEREAEERLALRYSAVNMAAETRNAAYTTKIVVYASFVSAATLVCVFWF